jgi:hypothetical protein
VDDGPLPDGAVPDALVLGGGEHGLQRVDAVGEQHPEAVGGAGVVVVLVGDMPHVNHLQHRLQRLLAVDVPGDRRHPAGGQLRRRRHRANFWRLPWEGGEERGEEPTRFGGEEGLTGFWGGGGSAERVGSKILTLKDGNALFDGLHGPEPRRRAHFS